MQKESANQKKTGEVLIVKQRFRHPLAMTMWDFSWLERRWPGAGYEDWDQALDELKLRGYDAVRIDAYPHLVAVDPRQEWELLPSLDDAFLRFLQAGGLQLRTVRSQRL